MGRSRLRQRYGRAHLSYAERQRLPARAFALEARRELPLVDATHVRDAASRLSMMRHLRHVTPAEARHASKRLHAAARRFGVELSK